MEAVGGDVHMAGNNVNITAKTDLHLKGSKVLLQGGDGAGGAVEIVANTFKTDTVFINNTVSGAVTQNVFGEYTIRQLLDPRASFNIISSGAMNITSAGDFSLNGAGRAEVLIAGLPPKPIPTAKSPAAFTLSVGTGNALMNLGAGNLSQSVTGALTQAVTGAITSTFDGNIASTFKGNVTRDFKGTMIDNVDGNVTTTYKGNYIQKVTGSHTVTSSGQFTHNITGVASILAQGVMTISGAQIYLN